MKTFAFVAVSILALGTGVAMPQAKAQTLLVDRTLAERAVSEPTRGMTMAQVQSRYGAPQSKLEPRGGQKRQWPTINRWEYPNFIVYFEKSKVIDVVLVKASPTEVGPAPAVR